MKEYTTSQSLDTLLSAVRRDFIKYHIETGNGVCMHDRFIKLLKDGTKKTTIRYSKGAIRVPCIREANLIETMENDRSHREYVGTVIIEKIVVKKFMELTEEDALNDGFSRKDDLIKFLNETYGKIAQMAPLAIYHIRRK
jgi:hypothetical protein